MFFQGDMKKVILKSISVPVRKNIDDLSGTEVHKNHRVKIIVIELHVNFINGNDFAEWKPWQKYIL
jgi:hypothetical protein